MIEHTADVGLRVWGPTVEAVFEEAATGLIALMGRASGGRAASERVELDADDVESLFVDWLSEILFLFDARGFVPAGVRVSIEDGQRLRATIDGVVDAGFSQEGPAVKAVTYHALAVGEREATVYLDV